MFRCYSISSEAEKLRCPRCHEEMTILCRRGPTGFVDEFYEKCLFCGYSPITDEAKFPKEKKVYHRSLLRKGAATNALIVTCLIGIILFAVLQIPIPQRVFAFETSAEPYVHVFKAIRIINFTLSRFSLNYSEGQIRLNVSADYISLESYYIGENVTLYSFILGSVHIHYRDATRSFDMGLSSLTLNVKVDFTELTIAMEGIANLPLWTAIFERLSGG